MSTETILLIGIILGILIGSVWIIYRIFRSVSGIFSSEKSDQRQTKTSPQSKVRLSGSNYTILVDFVPQRCDKTYEIQSQSFSTNDRVYKTNPYRFQCDCDWVKSDVVSKLEKDVPSRDIRRFCRHMVSACRRSRVFSKEVNESDLPLELQTFLNEGFRQQILRFREIDGRRAIFAYNREDEWINIFLESPKKTKFTKYGFNIYENRWSYSKSPPGLSQTFRQAIEEEIYEND